MFVCRLVIYTYAHANGNKKGNQKSRRAEVADLGCRGGTDRRYNLASAQGRNKLAHSKMLAASDASANTRRALGVVFVFDVSRSKVEAIAYDLKGDSD